MAFNGDGGSARPVWEPIGVSTSDRMLVIIGSELNESAQLPLVLD
jgi:hypothetical protein